MKRNSHILSPSWLVECASGSGNTPDSPATTFIGLHSIFPRLCLLVLAYLLFSHPSHAQSPVHVRIAGVQGTHQIVIAGQEVKQPFVARVTRDDGTPVAGAAVKFLVRSCGTQVGDNVLPPCLDPLTYGHFVGPPIASSLTVTTDADGIATAGKFVAGALSGPYNLSVLLTDLDADSLEEVNGELLTDRPPSFMLQFEVDQTASAFTLGGYMSGNWYDPDQAGQGFQLEFTSQEDTVVAIWFGYTPDGSAQNWIYAQGTFDRTQNSLEAPASIFSGARFPPYFHSSDVQASDWGYLEFAFTDCNHGYANWSSYFPDYASGVMPLTRLTQVEGTTCP